MKGCVQWYLLAVEKISPGAGLELRTSKIQIRINLMFNKDGVTPTFLLSHICYRNRDWNNCFLVYMQNLKTSGRNL